MLLSLALDDFLDAKTMRHNPTTNKWYAHKLNVFLAYCNEQNVIDTDALAPATVRAFLRHLRARTNRKGQPLASKTLHCYLKVLSAFLHWLVRESIIPEKVARIEFPTLEKKVVQTFTEEQIGALLKACQTCGYKWQIARDVGIVLLLLDTGVRVSELTGLTLERVVLDSASPYVLVDGKGSKQREIGPLGKRTVRALRQYRDHWRPKRRPKSGERHFFLGVAGKPLSTCGVSKLLERIGNRAGVTEVPLNPHRFRHTFAYAKKRQGADVLDISKLLGHSNLAVTSAYLTMFSSRDARQGESVVDRML